METPWAVSYTHLEEDAVFPYFKVRTTDVDIKAVSYTHLDVYKRQDLERLNSIGVLLFNHDTDRVLGKVERAWNQDNRGVAVVEFDDDEAAETIRKKVAGGTLKGVSVRYSVCLLYTSRRPE